MVKPRICFVVPFHSLSSLFFYPCSASFSLFVNIVNFCKKLCQIYAENLMEAVIPKTNISSCN